MKEYRKMLHLPILILILICLSVWICMDISDEEKIEAPISKDDFAHRITITPMTHGMERNESRRRHIMQYLLSRYFSHMDIKVACEGGDIHLQWKTKTSLKDVLCYLERCSMLESLSCIMDSNKVSTVMGRDKSVVHALSDDLVRFLLEAQHNASQTFPMRWNEEGLQKVNGRNYADMSLQVKVSKVDSSLRFEFLFLPKGYFMNFGSTSYEAYGELTDIESADLLEDNNSSDVAIEYYLRARYDGSQMHLKRNRYHDSLMFSVYDMKLLKSDLSGLTDEELEHYELSESTKLRLTLVQYFELLSEVRANLQKKTTTSEGASVTDEYEVCFNQVKFTPQEFIAKFNRNNPSVYDEFAFFMNGNIGIEGAYSYGNFYIREGEICHLYHVRVFLTKKDGVSQMTGYAIYSVSVPIQTSFSMTISNFN